MKFRLYIIVILTVLACNKPEAPDCLKTTGKTDSLSIDLNSFETLNFDDFIHLQIIPDSINYAVVVGGKNIIDKILVDQNGDLISISDENKCKFIRDLSNRPMVKLHTTGFSKLDIYGSGDITFMDTMTVPTFKMDAYKSNTEHKLLINSDSCFVRYHIGGNTLHLEGQSHFTYFFSLGNHWMHADKMISTNIHVANDSSGDCFVNCSGILIYELRDTGDIWYTGDPDSIIIGSSEGTGEVGPM